MFDDYFHPRRKVIAFHTFLLLFFGVTMPRWAALTALVSANAIIVFLVCLGPTVLDSKTRGPFCMTVLSFVTRVELTDSSRRNLWLLVLDHGRIQVRADHVSFSRDVFNWVFDNAYAFSDRYTGWVV